MLAPLSWLKEYLDITLSPKELGERLTEVGLGTEKITKIDNDVIFEFEITPNRPDLLSIIGIAREIAAIEGKKVKYPGVNVTHPRGVIGSLKPKKILPLKIKTNATINPRFTGIIIDNVIVKESPSWLKDKLNLIGQRPINNIVDITNYVMLELGNPIHAFDYHKVKDHLMTVEQAKGGESFKSVDGISYHLPKGAVIISDSETIIDLCGIKGGFNSATFKDTKTIFIRVPVENPILIRQTSQALGLRSNASSIFERGVNAGGTIDALKKCVDLIFEIAGGEIASEIYDLKKEAFEPWKLNLRLSRLKHILGIEIPEKKILSILSNLNLLPQVSYPSFPRKRESSPRLDRGSTKSGMTESTIECTIPTYRNDLKIEEDLIEELARIYGYNNFPKTLPVGQIPMQKIPYFKDYRIDEKIKNILTSSGFSEVYTYSLISEKDIESVGIQPEKTLRIDNPTSREFEYLRPTLKPNLIKALLQNVPNNEKISLFELGKVYKGENLDEAKENYCLSGISNNKNYFEVKGIIERLYEDLGTKENPSMCIEIINEGVFFKLNYSKILSKINLQKKFTPLPKYPPIIEDLAIVAKPNIKTVELMDEIKKQNSLIVDVSLLDQFEETRTFHIIYQHRERNLTTDEVAQIREKILKSLKQKFGARLKV